MLWETLSATRDIGRLYDIASVLLHYGFGDVARRLGITGALERVGRTLRGGRHHAIEHMTSAERVRRALEDMGPTFVKLGQILSTRVDLFAPDWIAEFEKLQDHAAPVPFDQIRAQLATDLAAEPDSVFVDLDPLPLAAGSIAQVHRARLQDGTAVVLKVRRPGIESVVDADLRLLQHLAELVESEWPALQRYQPRALVRQFAKSLRRELDLRTECRNAERIAANLSANENIVVPTIYWQWATQRLNVQIYVDGIPGRELAAVDESGLDRRILARRGANAVFQMVLEDGFFHADPHPGNVFYLPENRLAFIDFGMVGRLSQERRDQLADLLYSFALRDPEHAAELLVDWADKAEVDMQGLRMDIDSFIDEFHGLPLEQIEVGRLLGDLTALMREHRLTLPPDLALLFKAAISLEGLGRMLDPGFDMVSEARPFLVRIGRQRRSPRALARLGAKSLREAAALAASLPGELRRLLKAVDRGSVTVHVDVSRLDRVFERMDRAVSRLTMGIVTAALIIGSSIVMTVKTESTWLGLPLFGLLGFLGAVVSGIWLLLSIAHSGRHE
ncbi:MAG: ubiquinone biosynthesis protein UbiB [Betaproteobacteria bacterium]|nr:ubiquinone biosynthesis protein UbiB [Betaproteobacteria bacterium]